MAIPDWVQQSVQPLHGAMSWQPPPQDPYEAAAQAGMPYQEPVAIAPAPVAPVAPVVTEQPIQPGAMSGAEPLVSTQPELNYTPAPIEEPQPVAQPQTSQTDLSQQVVDGLITRYLTGSQTRIPAHVAKAAEQWQQSVQGPMPGQESQYAAARQALEEQQNEMLLDQRLAMQDKADLYDQESRNAYLQGRGYASEAAAIQADQEQRRALIDERVGELDRLIDQRSKLQTSFSERNPVRDMSMWTRIAIGIGAAGQALAGGENAALTLAMREIDADMAKQRDQVDALGLEIAGKRTLLGDMLQKFRDPAAADHATRAAMLGLYESGYRAQAAKEKSAEMRTAMTTAADALLAQREQEKLAALTGEHSTLVRWNPARSAGVPGGILGLRKMATDLGYKDGTPEFREFMQNGISGELPQYIASGGYKKSAPTKDEMALARFDQDHKVRLEGGQIGYVKDKGDYEKTITSLNKMDANLGRLRKYVVSGSAWTPTDRANVEAITNMAMGEIRVMLGLGVMSESDKELAQKLTGEFVNDRFSLADKLKRLETLNSLTAQTRREYESRISADPNANFPITPQIRSVRAK